MANTINLSSLIFNVVVNDEGKRVTESLTTDLLPMVEVTIKRGKNKGETKPDQFSIGKQAFSGPELSAILSLPEQAALPVLNTIFKSKFPELVPFATADGFNVVQFFTDGQNWATSEAQTGGYKVSDSIGRFVTGLFGADQVPDLEAAIQALRDGWDDDVKYRAEKLEKNGAYPDGSIRARKVGDEDKSDSE